jgi:hypothetical protein
MNLFEVPSHLTHERIAELRRMTAEDRWREAEGLYWEARRQRADLIKKNNPDWLDDVVEKAVKLIFLLESMKEC